MTRSAVFPTSAARRAVLLAGTAVLGTLLAAPGAQPAEAAAKPGATATFRARVVTATVQQRTGHHASRLTRQTCLDTMAQAQAGRMARRQTLFHQPLGPVLEKCGLREVGENVAYGYPSARATVAAWMRSPGHRANILHTSYRRIGVGAVRDSHGRWWVCEVFGRTR